MNMFARLTWIVRIRKARSLVAVVTLDMSLDEQNWRLCWFILITLSENICFRHDWLHLKVDISSFLCIYFSCLLRQVFVEIQLVLFTYLWRDVTKRTIYFFILQITLFFNPLQFQMIPYSDLYNQNWVFLVFQSSCKKRDWCGLRPQRVILLKQVAARKK